MALVQVKTLKSRGHAKHDRNKRHQTDAVDLRRSVGDLTGPVSDRKDNGGQVGSFRLAADMRATLTEVATEIVAQAKLDLVVCEIKPVGRDWRLVLHVERWPGFGGVTLGECALIAKALQARLDGPPVVVDNFELEVSSPGMERPLRHYSDFTRFIGADARVSFQTEAGELQVVVGLIQAVIGESSAIGPQLPAIVMLLPNPKGKRAPAVPLTIALAAVTTAQLAPTLAQWIAIGGRLAAETPDIKLDTTGGESANADSLNSSIDADTEAAVPAID
ncbi:MAG: hypothetical protein EXR77_05450 [Myxococcales bacterium]|nr:hypothetical protein [Myxococcales bacterium]